MPVLAGRFVPVLRVSDAGSSALWYRGVLGLREDSRHTDGRGVVQQVVLSDAATGLSICLVGPGRSNVPFDDHAVGLDHLELLVDHADDLKVWAAHLDAVSVTHSGIKSPPYTAAAMITFRDPDGIQLELYCPGAAR